MNKKISNKLLDLTPDMKEILERTAKSGTLKIEPVNLPNPTMDDDCNHFGWPIATISGETIVVMHRKIPGHNALLAGLPSPTMSYGIVLRSEDGGKTWSKPYDLRECMLREDRNRGGLVPLSHRFKFDKNNTSKQGYKIHLHSIGITEDGGFVAINNHGVFRSDDQGLSWKHFSKAFRDDDDSFQKELVSLGPRILDIPNQGLFAFGNWAGLNETILKTEKRLPKQFVVLNSKNGGQTWNIEEYPVDFPQYEPAAIYYEGKFLFITRDQTEVKAHKQIIWNPGRSPKVINTNLKDPQYIDTVDLSFNPVTKRFEIVRSERYHMELWLWSIDPEQWETGIWKRECRLFARNGKFYQTADGFHPAGAVIDEKQGLQHIFIYCGAPGGPTGIFRISRTLDTPNLCKSLL